MRVPKRGTAAGRNRRASLTWQVSAGGAPPRKGGDGERFDYRLDGRFQPGRVAWSCIKRDAERGAIDAPLGVTDLLSNAY